MKQWWIHILFVIKNGWQEATISLSDHPISFDDEFFCVFEIKEKLFIQSINETGTNPSLEKIIWIR